MTTISTWCTLLYSLLCIHYVQIAVTGFVFRPLFVPVLAFLYMHSLMMYIWPNIGLCVQFYLVVTEQPSKLNYALLFMRAMTEIMLNRFGLCHCYFKGIN